MAAAQASPGVRGGSAQTEAIGSGCRSTAFVGTCFAGPKKGIRVEVHVENGALHIRGERREEQKEEGEHFFRLQRRHGAFLRTIPLPEGCDEDQIQATYNDGVLEVVVPGAAEISGGKKIPVQITGKLKKTLGKGRNGSRQKKE